jgi:hypothetical protein
MSGRDSAGDATFGMCLPPFFIGELLPPFLCSCSASPASLLLPSVVGSCFVPFPYFVAKAQTLTRIFRARRSISSRMGAFFRVGRVTSPFLSSLLLPALTRIFRARRTISSRMGAFSRVGRVTPSLPLFPPPPFPLCSPYFSSPAHSRLATRHWRMGSFMRPLSTRRTYSFFGRWTIVHRLGFRRVRVRPVGPGDLLRRMPARGARIEMLWMSRQVLCICCWTNVRRSEGRASAGAPVMAAYALRAEDVHGGLHTSCGAQEIA